MRRHELVHDRHPFEKDVRDVEGCQQPLVLVVGDGEVVGQACDFCVADLCFNVSTYKVAEMRV